MKIFLILLLLLLSINIGYGEGNCAFGICNVSTDIISNTDTDIKITITKLVKYFLTFYL
ncbi:MAG: hypothetical protein Q9M97_04980 [Candidatus Gracilibacteria bacterium]|nr:hypothetical protein [Candidatus Gracilibacteria bacterium]